MTYYFYKSKVQLCEPGCCTYRAIVTDYNSGEEEIIGYAESDCDKDGKITFGIRIPIKGNCMVGDIELLDLAKNPDTNQNDVIEYLGWLKEDEESENSCEFVKFVQENQWR